MPVSARWDGPAITRWDTVRRHDRQSDRNGAAGVSVCAARVRPAQGWPWLVLLDGNAVIAMGADILSGQHQYGLGVLVVDYPPGDAQVCSSAPEICRRRDVTICPISRRDRGTGPVPSGRCAATGAGHGAAGGRQWLDLETFLWRAVRPVAYVHPPRGLSQLDRGQDRDPHPGIVLQRCTQGRRQRSSGVDARIGQRIAGQRLHQPTLATAATPGYCQAVQGW